MSLEDVGVRFRMWRRNRRLSKAHQPGGDPWRLWGLRHASFDVQQGECVGIIGSNGAGKTTLLRVVAGVYTPDEGRVTARGRVAPLLTAGAGLLPGLDGWANLELAGVLLGLSRQRTLELMPEMAEFSGLDEFLGAPVRTYSAGMKARLGFAAAIHCEPDILLLDEIMAVGDKDFREKSSAKIRELGDSGCTILIASHEVEKLAEVAIRLIVVDKGTIVDAGPAGEILERYLETRPPKAPRSRVAPGLG
jgi:ABC-type polysaccharide/polyol phosphate transport system ATPase subunit